MHLALLFALAACTTNASSTSPTCALDVPVPTPAEAAPGESVSLLTHPLTEARDTVVTVGDARAEVLDVVRTDCGACDDCRDDSGCRACGPVCPACVEACAPCVERVEVAVPVLPPGDATVTVRNGLGVSAAGSLHVRVAGADTGADSGF